jgi:serine O-acetyltransferase
MAEGASPQHRATPTAHRVSSTVEDWSRETKPAFAWDPPRSLLASVRAYQRAARSRAPWRRLARKWAVLRHRFWSAITGADIPLDCKIAGGLILPHPNGVVIHPDAEIGPNCLIFQKVTVGVTDSGAPRIAGHVDIGAGAKVLGAVRVGERARIGANAVVLDNVLSGSTVGGIPARVLTRRANDPASLDAR